MVVFSGPAAVLTVTPMRLLSSRRASSPYFSVPEGSMVAVKAAKSGLCSATRPAPLKVICILTMGSSCRSTSVMVTHDIEKSLEIVDQVIFLAHGEGSCRYSSAGEWS